MSTRDTRRRYTRSVCARVPRAWPDVEHDALLQALMSARRSEQRLRQRVSREANGAAMFVAGVGVAMAWAVWNPSRFLGEGPASLLTMSWVLYVVLVASCAAGARSVVSLARARSLRHAHATTAMANSRLIAWRSARHYRPLHLRP